MRQLIDPGHVTLIAVLDELIAENVDITVREVARRHPTLNNASAFTRHVERSELIAAAQQRQQDARNIVLTGSTAKRATMAEKLRQKCDENEALEMQIRHLVAAHAGLIGAVQRSGGVNALERFWTTYKTTGDTVRDLGGIPDGSSVVPLKPR